MKKIIYGSEARKGLKEGLDIVANAVKVTMGAKGLPVAIDRPYTTPLVTKDGVTVAESIQLENPLLNMGANMIISAASKTNDSVGDGTSTSVVLTQSIVEEGMNTLEEGASFYEMKKGMEFATEKVIDYITKNSISIKDDFAKMKAIPTISANNDEEIGQLIAETFQKVGERGFISVEDSKTAKTHVEFSTGLKFKMAPESQFMFQDTIKKTSSLSKVKLLLYIGRITQDVEILPAIEMSAGTPLVIICNEIDPLLLSRIVAKRLQKPKEMNITVIQCPEFGVYREEAMEDIALMCGARLFLQESDDNISQVTLSELGCAEKIEIDEETTSFINASTKETVEERINLLIEKQKLTEDKQDLIDLKERVARLKGGVVRIHVGATSEMEMREKKDRIVDAVHALTAAYKEGVVVGGGTALLNAAKNTIKNGTKFTSPSYKQGVEVIMKAIQAPVNQILKNAGFSDDARKEITGNIKGNKGFDVIKEKYTDLVKAGILDPLLVTVSALKNSLSVAVVFLSTEAVLVDETNWKTKDIKFADGI